MENILEELNQIPGVMGSMIIGKDGLVIVPLWEQDVDMDMVGAHSADILGAAESLMEEKFKYGSIDMLTLETKNANFFLKSIDDNTFMAVAVSPTANLGLIRLEIRSAAEKLEEVL